MTEAKFALSFDFTTIRGDSYEEFVHNCKMAFGEQEGATVAAVAMSNLRNHYLGEPTPAQAQGQVTGTLGGEPPQQWSGGQVGQYQPQGQYMQQQSQPQQAAGPAVPDPGPCAHGPRKYVAAGIAKGSGRPYPAFWACNAPQGQQKCR